MAETGFGFARQALNGARRPVSVLGVEPLREPSSIGLGLSLVAVFHRDLDVHVRLARDGVGCFSGLATTNVLDFARAPRIPDLGVVGGREPAVHGVDVPACRIQIEGPAALERVQQERDGGPRPSSRRLQNDSLLQRRQLVKVLRDWDPGDLVARRREVRAIADFPAILCDFEDRRLWQGRQGLRIRHS